MFKLYVMQNQWLILALIGGLALLLVVILFFPAFWRFREAKEDQDTRRRATDEPVARWLASFLPWYLIVILVVSLVYSIFYIIRMVQRPPNW